MHVSPKHVRFKPYELPDGMKAGANGRPDEASAETGRELLTLKVDAGVKQINALLAGWGEEVQDRKQLVREKNFVDRLTTAATE
jgi:hypothetical protein